MLDSLPHIVIESFGGGNKENAITDTIRQFLGKAALSTTGSTQNENALLTQANASNLELANSPPYLN